MKKLLLLLLLLGGTASQAIVIPIDLGPPRTIAGERFYHTSELFIHSNALTGTPVAGQPLSLDYEFSNYVRLNVLVAQMWYVSIWADTDGVPTPGIYPSVCSSGYMVRADGTHGPTLDFSLGGMLSNDHPHSILFFGLVYPSLDPRYLYSGMHFDLLLPDMEGVEITGLNFHFDSNSFALNWQITDTVPETGSTLALLTVALGALYAGQRKRI